MAEIDQNMRDTSAQTARSHLSPPVREALEKVNREDFVPVSRRQDAWNNYPLPIGYNQTISQPFIVALMTELLDLSPADRVLEIGTGSGYQTAILLQLAKEVFSIERIFALYEQAEVRLRPENTPTLHLRCGNGFSGWPEAAPFDAIIVTAAPETIPPALEQQLAENGRLVMPLGIPGLGQVLYRGVKHNGSLIMEAKLDVSFVPLIDNS
ncbi:MAG: protein-L-isoaspartate(D-aspartate) O-methyltransferase [Hahellaceae bacterium]|nr:protein-L-isoaspartate(D-aspartate) O-methyltransferase [Hahellaceae bacterium]